MHFTFILQSQNSNDVFSTSNSSKGGSSLQRPSQVLIPFLGQDGKSIVYRLNCSANVTKIANSQLGSLSHKSPSPLRPVVSSHLTHPQETQNASNRPRLSLTTKVPGSISSSNLAHVGPRLHPVEQTAKKAISLAPNVIKNGITFRTTPLSSELYKDTVPPCAPCPTQQKHPESQKSSASPMSSVSKVVPSMVSTFSSASQQGSVESATKFQRIPSMLQHPAQPQMLTPTKTTTVTSNPISLGQQQVLLVPIANQNGKTTYLQIPTQSSLNSSPEQSQSPTVSPTVMNSYTKGTMDSPIRAPQRLIPALSPRRQTPSAFPRKIAMTKPPPLVPLMARNKPCGLNTSASKSTTTPAITSANNNNTKSVMLPVTSTGNFSMPSLVSSFDSSHNTKGLLQNSLPTGAFSTVNHRQNCNTYATSTLVSKSHSGQALSNALPSDQSSECPSSSSSFFNIAVTGSSGATSTETSLPGSGSLTSANIVSLISNNPTLASIVQKYTEKGHQVVIMQQGDNLVFQAVPSGSNSTLDCSSTASPMVCQSTTTTTTITSTTTNTTTTTQPLQQRALENIACTTSGTQVQYQQSEGQNASYQIHVPATGSGEFSVGDSPNSLSKVETNSLVCATEMDNVNQHSETEAKLGNTLKNEVGGKLVIIQDSVSNHQTYGLLLDNGQLIPLNVTIS